MQNDPPPSATLTPPPGRRYTPSVGGGGCGAVGGGRLREGRVAPRCLRQIKRSISVCRGRQMPRSTVDAGRCRAPQQEGGRASARSDAVLTHFHSTSSVSFADSFSFPEEPLRPTIILQITLLVSVNGLRLYRNKKLLCENRGVFCCSGLQHFAQFVIQVI